MQSSNEKKLEVNKNREAVFIKKMSLSELDTYKWVQNLYTINELSWFGSKPDTWVFINVSVERELKAFGKDIFNITFTFRHIRFSHDVYSRFDFNKFNLTLREYQS